MARTRTIPELRRELAAKERQLDKLRARREEIARKLAAVDGEIAALGGASVAGKQKRAKKVTRKRAAGKRTRARKGPSLADVLAGVMAGKGRVKVADAAKLAIAAGYKSKSGQFGNVVSQALGADKRFKKIARGIFVLKGGRKPAAPKKAAAAKKTAKKAKAPRKKAAAPAAKPEAQS